MGWSRLARLVCALAVCSLPFGGRAFASPCTPNLTVNTPTPTLSWDHVNHANTIGYRVYWKRDTDATWRGFVGIPAWVAPEGASASVWPGVTFPVAAQKIVPNNEPQGLIDFMVVAYSSTNQESAPSTILRICMPHVWKGGDYY